jgi:SpoVK/Ycf46/Vps4 family AAA+-type ATPase
MATANQIKALLRSYSDADGDKFLSIATQIAAHAARSGQSKVATELKEMVEEIRAKQKQAKIGGAVPIARPTGELSTILSVTYPKTRLSEMVLEDTQRSVLDRVIREYRQQGKLREFALSARRKLLLVGPPGCGKTMSSHALASELSLPHFSVQLHALITKFMGETATKLYAVFQAMNQTRGVYLFDEFDAIGGQRSLYNDVGEIRRVLNSFLTFLEEDDSDSLIIAATNNVDILDEALFRRFDDIIVYNRPTKEQARQLIKNRLVIFATREFDWERVAANTTGLSHAEICRACDDASKDAVLENKKQISCDALVYAMEARKSRFSRLTD